MFIYLRGSPRGGRVSTPGLRSAFICSNDKILWLKYKELFPGPAVTLISVCASVFYKFAITPEGFCYLRLRASYLTSGLPTALLHGVLWRRLVCLVGHPVWLPHWSGWFLRPHSQSLGCSPACHRPTAIDSGPNVYPPAANHT